MIFMHLRKKCPSVGIFLLQSLFVLSLKWSTIPGLLCMGLIGTITTLWKMHQSVTAYEALNVVKKVHSDLLLHLLATR